MPTRNYYVGVFENFERIGGEALLQLVNERGGSVGKTCMPGCLVKCSNLIPTADGAHLTSALEYETLAMLGANLLIDDLEIIAALDRKCDNYGLDTIEIGAALSLLAETDYFSFGDGQKALNLLDEIGSGTPLGRILGQGATGTAKAFGVDRVPAVKGQALPAHDARAMKGMGVTYATSPQGADHTAGFVGINNLSKEGHIERSRQAQINNMIIDSAGICYFSMLSGKNELLAELVSGFFDVPFSEQDIVQLGQNALLIERDFNRRAGITAADDRLPDFLLREPLPPHDTVWDIDMNSLDDVFLFKRE